MHDEGESPILIGDWEFRPLSRILNSPYEGRIVLTEPEARLLHLLARHPNRPLSRERISARS